MPTDTDHSPSAILYGHRLMREAGIPLTATVSDGDDTAPMVAWLVDNEDDPEVVAEILSLTAVGASRAIGGGGSALVTLTRIA